MSPKWLVPAGLSAVLLAVPLNAAESTATPPELVSAYEKLADTILGAKHTEEALVRSILAMTYRHAEATLGRALGKIKAGQPARAEIESLADLVAQLGNEGDSAVAGVRKRLLEGGHHHNAEGEKQGIFDEGFVVVTRAAKKVFLDAATRIGKMAAAPAAAALEGEWATISKQYQALAGGGR